MTLINMYTGWSGWETLFGILAVVMLIVTGVVCMAWVIEAHQKKIPIIVTSTLVAFAFVLFAINTFAIDNYTYYKYYVTDMNQLTEMVDNGYIITDSTDNPVYTLRKGE